MTQAVTVPQGLVQWQSQLLTDTAPSLVTQAGGLLKVYQQNRYHALLACVKHIYVQTRRVLGDEFFYHIMPLYLRSSPLASLNLNEYGQDFSHWMNDNVEELQGLNITVTENPFIKHHTLIVDLSQAEWHCHAQYYAADEAGFDFSAYAQLTQAQASDVLLYASRHLVLMSSHYDLNHIMQTPTLSGKPHTSYYKHDEPRYFCIVREQYHGQLFKIEASQYRLLEKLKNGLSINQMLACDDFSHQLDCLSQWIAQGWIRTFKFDHSSVGLSDV